MTEQARALVEVQGLHKRYGQLAALRGLDLTLLEGEFVTLFGPNGAGKSTLIYILSHLLRPTSGTVRVLGVPLAEMGPEIRRQIGVITHQTLLTPQLTGRENLLLIGRLFRVEHLTQRVEEVLEQVALTDRADEVVSSYSKGMSQRMAIARAILHRPRIILLDEPYTGLDPHAAELLTALLRALKDGTRTLMMTTHSLEQGLELSDRICIQAHGRILHTRPTRGLTPESLRRLYTEQLEQARQGRKPLSAPSQTPERRNEQP